MNAERFVADARWLDALSGQFYPATNPERRPHTLSRLAIATYEKGRGPENHRDYVPSWSPDTYVMLEQSGGELPVVSRITIAESQGRWPREVSFGHEVMQASKRNYLVIRERGLDVDYPLDGSISLDVIQRNVTEIAQDFYG